MAMVGLLWGVLGTALAADPVVDDVNGGVINWSQLRLEVTITSRQTRGAWQDRRLQEQDALEMLKTQMGRLAYQIPITPELTAGEVMEQGGPVGEALTSGMDRWFVEETRYYTQGGVELVGVLDLKKWLRPVLLDLASSEELPAPERTTGLLIDARGLSVPLSLCPSLRTASGTVLLSPAGYSDEMARRQSPVQFVLDPADPAAVARVGDDPLMIRAADVDSDGTLILAEDGTLSSTHETIRALVSRGSVTIVVD